MSNTETIIDEFQVIFKHYRKASFSTFGAGVILGAYPSYEVIQFIAGLL
jgi:hypothetical protein